MKMQNSNYVGKIERAKLFKYYQPNKKDIKDKYGDCVVRALTKALNKTWLEVYDDLIPIARELQCIPNSKTCYEPYLQQQGLTYQGVSNKRGTVRPTVASFARDHKKGTYIARVANHIVAIVDGHYFDTWDSGLKSLYGYWKK